MLSFVLVAALFAGDPPALDAASLRAMAAEISALKAKVAVLEAKASLQPVAVETTIKEKKHKTIVKTRTTSPAFECVNNQRIRKGLRPFVWDDGLTRAAEKCVHIKAQQCHSGHLGGPMSDFACLDPGVHCDATGADGSKIAANDPNFWTCCMDEPYTYAGAGMEVGPDGCKYYSLFVRR